MISQKLFKDLEGGDVFISNKAEIFYTRLRNRPWAYIKVKDSNQAVFIPTGELKEFNPADKVIIQDIKFINN